MSSSLSYFWYKNTRILAMAGGWRRTDEMILVYSAEIPDAFNSDDEVLNAVFEIHNQDDRPTAQDCPAMSVGDIVEIHRYDHDVVYAVEMIGFTPINSFAISKYKTWKDYVDAEPF